MFEPGNSVVRFDPLLVLLLRLFVLVRFSNDESVVYARPLPHLCSVASSSRPPTLGDACHCRLSRTTLKLRASRKKNRREIKKKNAAAMGIGDSNAAAPKKKKKGSGVRMKRSKCTC